VRGRAAPRPQIEKLARDVFGWERLRPGQLDTERGLLSG
jgi:hypothetical protein